MTFTKEKKIAPSLLREWTSCRVEEIGLELDYEFPLTDFLEEVLAPESKAFYREQCGGENFDSMATSFRKLTRRQRIFVWIALLMTAEVKQKLKVLKKDSIMFCMIKESFYRKNIGLEHKMEIAFMLSAASEISFLKLLLSDKIPKDIIDTEAEEAE